MKARWRQFRDDPGAWPAGGALAACLGLLVLTLWPHRGSDIAALRARADAAVANGDVQTAELLYQHLLVADPSDPAPVVAWARALDRLGRRREALAVLGAVAPVRGGGDPAAHLLLADWLVETRALGGRPDADLLRRALRHLDAAAADATLAPQAGELRRTAQDLLAADTVAADSPPTTRP